MRFCASKKQKAKPTEQGQQRDMVLRAIRQALNGSAGPVLIWPGRMAERLAVHVRVVNQVIDDGETSGDWYVKHQADGSKIVRSGGK